MGDLVSPEEVEFLQQSNAIEDIVNIDYSQSSIQQAEHGHVSAWLMFRRWAREGHLPDAAELCQAQRCITEEQLRYGHHLPAAGVGALRSPENGFDVRVGNHVAPGFAEVASLVGQLLDDLQRDLSAKVDSALRAVEIAGGYLQRFEVIHPFVDGNGRMGRLLANYLLLRSNRPILVFRADDRPAFYAAHRSHIAMCIYLADNLRQETPCFSCRGESTARRVGSRGLTDQYHCDRCGQDLLIEWHVLAPLYALSAKA